MMHPEGPATGALAGLRVLDLSRFLAAPQVSALLGDFGADVVKVEPPGGDPMRRMGVQRDGQFLLWAMIARNKRSIVVDFDTEEGLRQLHQLTSVADVVVTNQPTALLRRWGCTPEEIAERNDRAVVVTVSCYGSTGPYADRSGAGSTAEAFAGLTYLTGEPDGPPTLSSVPLGDSLVGISGLVGTLLACYHRDAHGGSGQHVDVSMYEPVLALLGPVLAGWRPGDPPPRRTGSRVPGGAPRNVYRTGDGRWVALSGTTDDQVARIMELIGEDGARFGRAADRVRLADELDALVAGWIAQHGYDDVLSAFDARRIPIVPVNDLAHMAADPQVVARGSVVELRDPVAGVVTMPAPSPRLAATPGCIRSPGPALGADRDAVLRDWLEAPERGPDP